MIILKGALANVNHEVSNDDLVYFLNENIPDAEIYKIKPMPGVFMNAPLDWHLIISDVSGIISIATVIWNAYKKFIKPIKDKGNENAFLFISIEVKNENKQYLIGEQYKNKEEFIREFANEAQKINSDLTDEEVQVMIEAFKNQGLWEKIE